jgi:hypothetical protein
MNGLAEARLPLSSGKRRLISYPSVAEFRLSIRRSETLVVALCVLTLFGPLWRPRLHGRELRAPPRRSKLNS